MRTLTEDEVLDFISEVQLRPTLWYGKDRLWVRRQGGENSFALKFVNGLPNGMSTLYVRRLREQESEESVERYVDWLLSKFTSYAWRKSIEDYLTIKLAGWDEGGPDDIAEMARFICAPSSSTRTPEPVILAQEPTPAGVREPDVRVEDPITLVPKRRSPYLEKLLRGK